MCTRMVGDHDECLVEIFTILRPCAFLHIDVHPAYPSVNTVFTVAILYMQELYCGSV